jgi:hypothetical protein
VEVYGATVRLSGSTIENGTNVHGVWASGVGTDVLIEEDSFIQGMVGTIGTTTVDGLGVVAANAAEVRVYGSTIQGNDATGAAATGLGSILYLYQTEVLDNGVNGVASQSSAGVAFKIQGQTTTIASVVVDNNALGGLVAASGGDILAGNYNSSTDVCTDACENSILNHFDQQSGGRFDAGSYGTGSLLYAEYDTWGGRTALQLELEGVTNNIHVDPVWPGPPPRMGGGPMRTWLGGPRSPAPLGGEGEATGTQPDSSAVAALVDEAYTAASLGDSAAAVAALLEALPLAATPDEIGLAYGTAARFLSHGGDEALEGYLATRTATEDGARPWAMAALMAAEAAEGRAADAWVRADTLAAEYGGTDHALLGYGMAARLAAQAGDLASAKAALTALQAGWPEMLETESAAALVRRLQEADSTAGRLGAPGGDVLRAVSPTPAAGEAAASFSLLGARPNPFTGRTTVPFEVATASRVRVAVYDVLGREVAVLADEAFQPGRYEAVFDGRGMASGLYLAQARVESGAGVMRNHVVRITLVR